MNKEFCIYCGHKNLFEVTRPKFCAGCGGPFNTSQVTASKGSSPARPRMREEEEGGDKEGHVDVASLNLETLRQQVTIIAPSDKVTLDDLWKAPAPREETYRAPSNDPAGEAILKKVLGECASTKAPKEIVVDE